jgi:hypothetical protein
MLEQIFIYIGWVFVVLLALGTVAIIFTDIFKRLTNEQRIVFAVVSPSVVGYVLATELLGFANPIGVLGLIGIMYLIVPTIFFVVQVRRVRD